MKAFRVYVEKKPAFRVEASSMLAELNENLSLQGRGVNKRLNLGSQFSIEPLSNSGGSAVYVGEVPQFKIIFDSFSTYTLSNSYMMWVALLLFIIAAFLYLSGERSLQRFYIVQILFILVTLGLFLFGFKLQNEDIMFSPTLYADGPLLYSLASVMHSIFITSPSGILK